MGRKRKAPTINKREVNAEDDGGALLPVMSLMLILIPLLIGKVAFTHFKVIQANTPGMRQSNPDNPAPPPKKKNNPADMNVIVNLGLDNKAIKLDLVNEDTGESIKVGKIRYSDNKRQRQKMIGWLLSAKKVFKKLDTLMVSIDKELTYQQFTPYLADIKLPGTEKPGGKSLFKVVVLPQGSI